MSVLCAVTADIYSVSIMYQRLYIHSLCLKLESMYCFLFSWKTKSHNPAQAQVCVAPKTLSVSPPCLPAQRGSGKEAENRSKKKIERAMVGKEDSKFQNPRKTDTFTPWTPWELISKCTNVIQWLMSAPPKVYLLIDVQHRLYRIKN